MVRVRLSLYPGDAFCKIQPITHKTKNDFIYTSPKKTCWGNQQQNSASSELDTQARVFLAYPFGITETYSWGQGKLQGMRKWFKSTCGT